MMSDRNPEMPERPQHAEERSPSPRDPRGERDGYYREQYRRSRSRSPPPRSRSRSRSPYYRDRYRSRSRSPRRNFRERPRNGGYVPRNPNPRTRNEPAPPSKVIGVFGLNLSTRERDLKELFAEYSSLADISLVYDRKSDQSRGFAFISFDSLEEATAAKERTNGMELHGRIIRVDYSLTQRAHSPTPGEYMGHRQRRTHQQHRRRSPSPYYRRRHRSHSPSYTREDKRRYSRSRS